MTPGAALSYSASAHRPNGGAAAARAGRVVLVVGLGRTGLSCVRHLVARGREVEVVDSRTDPPALAALRRDFPRVRVTLGGFDPACFERAAEIVLSPGVPITEPAVARAVVSGRPLCGDVELFARAARAPVLAITGSNGKSTVTTLVGDMARHAGRRAAVGGNLGTPALDLLGDAEPDLYVLELSSFQLEATRTLEPAVACVLNVSPDHMDRYADLCAYVAAKRSIFRGRGAMVLNADDPTVAAMREPGRRVIEFGLGAPGPDRFGLAEHANAHWLAHDGELLLPVADLPVPGRHNVANALAALAIGSAAGFEVAAMVAALRGFRGLPHRCALVAEAGGVRWYDDSKGTNVGATVAAIEGLGADSPLVLIAGGDGKGADFGALREPAARHVRAAVLIGRDAARVAAALAGATRVVRAAGMREAVAAAGAEARPGDAVLLSPACASFDMYRSYEARGDDFADEVRRLVEA